MMIKWELFHKHESVVHQLNNNSLHHIKFVWKLSKTQLKEEEDEKENKGGREGGQQCEKKKLCGVNRQFANRVLISLSSVSRKYKHNFLRRKKCIMCLSLTVRCIAQELINLHFRWRSLQACAFIWNSHGQSTCKLFFSLNLNVSWMLVNEVNKILVIIRRLVIFEQQDLASRTRYMAVLNLRSVRSISGTRNTTRFHWFLNMVRNLRTSTIIPVYCWRRDFPKMYRWDMIRLFNEISRFCVVFIFTYFTVQNEQLLGTFDALQHMRLQPLVLGYFAVILSHTKFRTWRLKRKLNLRNQNF